MTHPPAHEQTRGQAGRLPSPRASPPPAPPARPARLRRRCAAGLGQPPHPLTATPPAAPVRLGGAAAFRRAGVAGGGDGAGDLVGASFPKRRGVVTREGAAAEGSGGRAARPPASSADEHPTARRAVEPLAAQPSRPRSCPCRAPQADEDFVAPRSIAAGADPSRRAQAGAVMRRFSNIALAPPEAGASTVKSPRSSPPGRPARPGGRCPRAWPAAPPWAAAPPAPRRRRAGPPACGPWAAAARR
jgi:hypothetical protein